MEKAEDLYETIHTLCSTIHQNVSETDLQIESLNQVAQLLAQGLDLDFDKEKPRNVLLEQNGGRSGGQNGEGNGEENGEGNGARNGKQNGEKGEENGDQNDNNGKQNDPDVETVIHDLENIRLNLVMEIQEEDFITQQLKDMIGDCEELVGGVINYYKGVDNDKSKEASSDFVKDYEGNSDSQVRKALELNLSRLEASRKSLHSSTRAMLEQIEREITDASSLEAEENLAKLIDSLNEKFDGLARNI